MKCPNDNATLLMTDRQGIEIDYCPDCRGIWLDKGELDKLISASATASRESAHSEPSRAQVQHQAPDEYGHKNYDEKYYKKKKRKDFLGDIFDF